MLNSLSKILDKKGSTYIDKFLNEELVITEKLDTFRLLFEQVNDKLVFYKKDNSKISLIDRTLSDIYENAIVEIESLIGETKLPESTRFGLYFSPTNNSLKISYENLPKYILTDVSKRNGDKIVESYSYEEVEHWSSILCMARPPIIFKGILNEEQKKVLIDYDTKQFGDNTMSFSEMIVHLFGKSYSNQEIIEGIIIESKDNLAQVISYEFDILNESYENKDENPRDIYDIVLMSINEFMDSYDMPLLESESNEQLYIDLICDMFNKYCSSNQTNESIDPKYLMPPKFGYSGNLNKAFISDENTLKLIESAPIYESLFKVMLSSFRKPKKSFGLLDESVVEKFNTYVYLINDFVNKGNKLNEDENIVVDAVRAKSDSGLDHMSIISTLQRAFVARPKVVSKGTQKCIVYLTTFNPFSMSQMTNIDQMISTWKCPVILAAISNKFKVKGKNFHFSDNLVKAQMRSLVDFNKDKLVNLIMIDSWDLTEIFEYCRPNYEPIVIITDKDKKAELSIQVYFEEEIMGGRINVEKDFNVGEMENVDQLQLMRSIEDGNAALFNELTPQGVHLFYDMIINEYKTWAQLIKNIEV